jgi:ATP-dependent helicase HrpB
MFFLDPPSPGRLAAAREELIALGALHADGTLLPKGKAMAALPLPPRLAALIAGTPAGPQRLLAAEVAALLSEAALGGASTDLRARLERFRQDRSPRARALAQQALRWAGSPAGPVAPVASLGSVLAAALPQHLARRRAGDEPRFLLAAGRAGRLPATDSLAGAEWLVVAGLTGAAGEGRITAAAPLTEAEALAAVPPETTEVAEYDRDRALLRARRITRIGAITLRETPLPTPSGPVALAALLAAVRAHGLSLVPAFAGLTVLLARCAAAQSGKARPTLLSEAMLLDQLEAWLAPLLGDPPRLDRPCTEALATAALGLLPWEARQYLDEAAPRQWRTPAGRLLEIDYTAEGGPTIAARVQEFYGCKVHPTVGEARRPLRVSLLSPAQRQIAITLDLPGFWAGAYRDMAKDMRGQYPRHDWPEDPGAAMAHVGKTKARLNREGA